MVAMFLPMQAQAILVMAASVYFGGATLFSRGGTVVAGDLWRALGLGALYIALFSTILFLPLVYHNDAMQVYGNWIAYLLFPFVFALATPGRRAAIIRELPYFVYACVALALITNIAFLWMYVLLHPSGLHITHVTYRIFFEQFSSFHPTYMSVYIAFAMCILLFSGGSVNRILKYVLFCLLLIFLLALLAKSVVIAVAIVLLHQLWLRRASLARYKYLFAGLALSIAVACTFIPFIGQRLQELAGRGTGGSITDNSVNTRKMILSVDKDMVRHHWLSGTGPGRMMHLMRERWAFISLQQGYDVSYFDPHNLYVYIWLSAGLAGLVLFCMALAMHYRRALSGRNYLYLYLLIVLTITFFTESVLARQQGIIFYALFTSLFYFQSQRQSVK